MNGGSIPEHKRSVPMRSPPHDTVVRRSRFNPRLSQRCPNPGSNPLRGQAGVLLTLQPLVLMRSAATPCASW